MNSVNNKKWYKNYIVRRGTIKKIGIPKGLHYYDYHFIWKNFFEMLGVQVITSTDTNKNILDYGVKCCVEGACLPIKIYHGHVQQIKKEVDYLFIPKIISLGDGEFECPKILGIAEMVKHSIEDIPPIISPKINIREGKKALIKAVLNSGKYFSNNPFKILKAYEDSIKEFYKSKDIFSRKLFENSKLKMLVLGHSYNIEDKYLNMDILNKIKRMNIEPITMNMLDDNDTRNLEEVFKNKMFWTTGRKIIGTAINRLYEDTINGIIYISSFGCGLDSILIDIVQREAQKKGIPFMILTIDEHTGEAGINTRIEAFVDMIKWRGSGENYFSTHG
ncbi:acyl-CoA dehydratase activase-related protein [Clostridiisalibacter paucivorans]|uniref:acyl-CoA dehydratase activase-related protein n=1 Tax=Clostridiisalibacter paucivorans TaxID=408753 RepID=UPI000684D313|nr:acyl-CoA dehydratase activase-related protein [Clostridiisalibacter paucivorans]